MSTLKIVQGSTLSQPFRWNVEPFIYIAIEAIVSLTPLRLRAASHGLLDGWRCELISLLGLDGLNSTGRNQPSDYHYATIIDPDTVEFNDIAGTLYPAYKSGGFIKCYTPMDISGHRAVLTIWDKVNGTQLLQFTSDDGDIALDPTECRITLNVADTETALIDWKKGVFGLDMIHIASGKSTKIDSGPVLVELE